jgi:WS/DGAT/MGAT family acyltransferase
MNLIPPTDALYLWAESATSPAHVIAMQLFEPPADAPDDLLTRLFAEMTDVTRLKPEFRRRAHRSARTGGQYVWVVDEDADIDMSLQVRRVGLPRPGRIRELLEHVSAYHAVRLDRDRPLWEAQLVEGLEDGRFALLTKMHHALFDGITMGRHLLGGLSTDPGDRAGTAPWIVPARTPKRRPRPERPEPSLRDRARAVAEVPAAIVGSARSAVDAGVSMVRNRPPSVPFSAPPTIFNRSVSSSRRFAGQVWPANRLREVATAAGVSTNDVALAMCSGALRSYLLELDVLPGSSLVAMVPISFRPRDEDGGPQQGNNWGAILCPLGTDSDDPRARLERINSAMHRNKTLMSSLDPTASTLLSATNMGGVVLGMLPGVPNPPRPPFNLIISNVPAVSERLYLDGCELTEAYPISVVSDGQALNITLVSYAGDLAVGITGCRRSVPHLQRLLGHLERSLAELEETYPAAG